ncbi:tRNA 2-thiocytidine biosynthesis TtcA family protein [Faecalispora anaeroviscerum]|uniref:tRNA 2-thiocytidine biosynthesis TtcA family protein n=1 Tax=Faecalispora anaeroviscerum TaxID=2991836 RepID=UPI0024B9694B|nr:tRNA 2-thiocytidine biosynthesis TtcA family protein [Faecalispora anaeroviscerum]
MEETLKIEQSILKKYRKEIWHRMIGGIKDYQLILPGDRIAVCISGGKDSMLLAKCLQMLQRHTEIPFELEFLSMDPGYNEYNRQLIAQNAEQLGIPLTLFSSRIFEIVSHSGGNPCYLCARMRRGHLYAKAKELGCNKIALAHHFDDVIETTMMSMLYGAEIRTMMPKLPSTNFPGMEIIRPLYLVRERDVLAWKRYNSLEFVRCGCPLSEATPVCTEKENNGSKRAMVKELIARLRKDNPQVDINIFRSMHNVNLDTVLGYRQDGQTHSFLDDYRQSASDIQTEGDSAEE